MSKIRFAMNYVAFMAPCTPRSAGRVPAREPKIMKKIPAQNNTLVELHVPDFGVVKDFYSKLGFRIVWERKPEDYKGYLVMEGGGNILCFYCGNEKVYDNLYFKKFPKETKKGYGVEIVIMIKDIEDFYKKVKEFANVTEKLIIQPWGLKDFRIEDPFGYYLRFTEPHDILDKDNAIP